MTRRQIGLGGTRRGGWHEKTWPELPPELPERGELSLPVSDLDQWLGIDATELWDTPLPAELFDLLVEEQQLQSGD